MPEGEEGAKISEQDFKDMFPVGTHIDYNGAEYVVIEHSKPGVEGGPSFEAVELSDTVTFSQVEFEEAEFEIHQEPTKIPQKTEYPPQVFLVAWEDGEPRAAIYKDLGALKGVHPRIDGDTIMEAISDPGTWQENGDFAVVFTSIG
jgi:hypothetical protein